MEGLMFTALDDAPKLTRTSRTPSRNAAWGPRLALAFALPCVAGASVASAQEPPLTPSPGELGPKVPGPSPDVPAAPASAVELEAELARLRQQSNAFRAELLRLEQELAAVRARQDAAATSAAEAPAPDSVTGVPRRFHSGAFAPSAPETHKKPIVHARYGYNADATGPLGGGGYFMASTANDEFSVALTSQITVDGTFYNHNRMKTDEQGFNIPFARVYLYGNITKYVSYQVGVQGFIGTFNLLDAFFAWHLSKHWSLRFGKALTPPLFEYFGFSPALEPVVTNSPLFQLAAKRPIGVMLTGTLAAERLSFWAGVTNSGASLFGNLDNNVDFNTHVELNPFRGERWSNRRLEGLGTGVGFSVGKQRYALHQSGIALTNNGEATTNPSFVTVVGIPWYVYNDDVRADGQRFRLAPHLYYFGRLSLLGEYMFHRRELTNGTSGGMSTQHAYYVNASFWVTGERDFEGNGFQGYSTVEPKRPIGRGSRGPGAFQLAGQWSQFFAGDRDIKRGLVDTAQSTERMDNLMAGLNWWPNKHVRLTVNYVKTWFDDAVPVRKTGSDLKSYQTAWLRFATFL
jgi:phosphate-selective porin OprO/OprP